MIFYHDRTVEDDSLFTTEFEKFTAWCLVELWAIIAIFGSNAGYLLTRALITQKTYLEAADVYKTETTDFLESQQ